MVTDLAEVFRLGTAKAKENLAFRRHLSAHRQAENIFQILASEVQQEIDCKSCANCCRESSVTVNHGEIEAIAAHLRITADEVMRLHTEPDPDGPALRTLRNTAGCVFLDGNLCMIYDARPNACRDFPHVAVGTHSLGGRPSSMGRWAALCPIIYNAMERYKKQSGFPSLPH